MKKMILVDPAHMLLKTSPVPDTLSESVLGLDDEIKRILDTSTLSEHDKVSAYEQVLYKYLTKVNKVNSRQVQPPPLASASAEPRQPVEERNIRLEKRAIDSLPKTLQTKGRVLLDHIKETTDLNWNDRGELVRHGETVSGSNIFDLVNELLRTRKLGTQPTGWESFAAALKESNIPMELVGNKKRWQATRESIARAESPPRAEPPDYRTPYRKRLRARKRSARQTPKSWLSYYE